MKIETITYKRVKNIGNYQSEAFEASATIREGEDPQEASQDLIAFVLAQLDIDLPVIKANHELPEIF